MDIQNTIISAKVVIESLVVLLENENVDISSIKFKVGSASEGYESPDMDFGKLIDLALKGLEEARVQAVPEWVDYSKQSPRIDGRYQVFIAGEQLTADYETPFGFSSAEDGTALIQELISHWSLLPEAPMQEQDHG